MKLTLAIAALGFMAFAAPSTADSLPRRGETDPRIRTAMYNADEVYRLTGFVGYLVDLEFEADLDHFFEELFKKVDAGEMTYDQMEGFFPQEVKDRARRAAAE